MKCLMLLVHNMVVYFLVLIDQFVNMFQFLTYGFFNLLRLFSLIVWGFVLQSTDSVFPLALILMFIFVECKCKLFHTAYLISASVCSEIHTE